MGVLSFAYVLLVLLTADPSSTLNIIQSALSLLHHLIYPIPLPRQLFSTYPTQSQSNRPPAHFSAEADPELEGDLDDKDLPQGVNFVQRLREVGSTFEFNGIAHQFISTLGVMSYGAPAIEVEKYKEVDIGAIQGEQRCLAMDLDMALNWMRADME